MDKNEHEYCKFIGKCIRAFRKYNKKSVRDFAIEIDIPQATLSRIERGENEIKLINLKKISEGFGWPLSQFFINIEQLESKQHKKIK